jgi:putative membrane protein
MKHKSIIVILSLLIPLVVALLYEAPKVGGFEIDFLPKVNAIINGVVFFTLIFAIKSIKNGKKDLHQKLIYLALILSTIFLVSYVIHHTTHDSVKYEGEGLLRYFYWFILLSHIILSAVIIPLVLITLSRALKENFEYHKKIAKITFPIWLYVSATGVVVYILISPYY